MVILSWKLYFFGCGKHVYVIYLYEVLYYYSEGKKHGFSRDAEEHIDKSFRPKPYKRSKRDHHPELSVSHRRIAATSQDPKVKSTRQRFTGSVVNDPEDQPPSWFFSYMDKVCL